MPKTTNKTKGKTNSMASIKIRMYRVGFGDCFLLSLPVGQGVAADLRHFVIDCGVHGQGNIGTIGDAVDDIGKVTDSKIAAVIATHSHQDHISGFSDKFTGFEIGEVWLPWCEDPKDELANKWRKKQAALTLRLEEHFAAQAKAGAKDAGTAARKSALAAIANLTSNTKAMGLLRGGFNVGATVRFLSGGDKMKDAAGIKGLNIDFLSPPRDQKFLARMDPPAGQGYLRFGKNGNAVESTSLKPFPSKWAMSYGAGDTPLEKKEETEIQKEICDTSLDALAFALDSAKNNTSLVTLFEYKGQYLLFPGDAQYGNWQYWLDGNDADEILSKVSFLKVGHHGSHNATPRSAVAGLTPGGFAAMVSTQSVPWDSIPRVPLMEALARKTKQKIVRSDWIDIASAPKPLKGAAPAKPANLPEGFTQGDFWYDYEIPVT
jgi:hypothetical protein